MAAPRPAPPPDTPPARAAHRRVLADLLGRGRAAGGDIFVGPPPAGGDIGLDLSLADLLELRIRIEHRTLSVRAAHGERHRHQKSRRRANTLRHEFPSFRL